MKKLKTIMITMLFGFALLFTTSCSAYLLLPSGCQDPVKLAEVKEEIKEKQEEEEQDPETELEINDTKVGKGKAVKKGDTISVLYVGTYNDGEQFDANEDKDNPLTFTVGEGEMITGFDNGVIGMKVGGVRELIIPSDQAYSDGKTRRFTVTLLKIDKSAKK